MLFGHLEERIECDNLQLQVTSTGQSRFKDQWSRYTPNKKLSDLYNK